MLKKLILVCMFCWITQDMYALRVLHLTLHKGCAKEIEGVMQILGHDLTTWMIHDLPARFFDDNGISYNIGHERARRIWEKHQAVFETFDCIITSDTAPLSRIFLQNGWKKPLIIWICNRFDYYDAASLDCDFPDAEYYSLFQKATTLPNVTMIAYTEFEHIYAQSKGINTGNVTISPYGSHPFILEKSVIPESVRQQETFFCPPYHNETIFMNLQQHLHSIGISAYCGRYAGPLDLNNFKGIICLPYSWSNLALFENMRIGLPYFIPSPWFFLCLLKQHNFFIPNASFLHHNSALVGAMEWYNARQQKWIVYFDSWHDLVHKINQTDFSAKRLEVIQAWNELQKEMLNRWKSVFNQLTTLE